MSGVKRWTIWECDCGHMNRANAPGLQRPCDMCGHPAPAEAVEVVPAEDYDKVLAEREKLRAEQRSALATDIEAGRVPGWSP